MEIKSLTNIEYTTIFEAFNVAFADYEMQLDAEQLHKMLIRRGFDPDLSFAAFEGNRIVAFTFNGVGMFNGIQTAYDTGTGTIKEYRGKGLATQIFNYSIPFLKERGIRQYLLEVLQHNTGAVSVYKKLGFEVSREFNYYRQKNTRINIQAGNADTPYSIKNIEVDNFPILSDFWDFYPSWQNSFDSIGRSRKDFVCLGAFDEDNIIGYAVFEPSSGDITQIAVDKLYRKKGVASSLLKEMLKMNECDSVKVINTDVQCASITGFLASKNIIPTGMQYEMIKIIS